MSITVKEKWGRRFGGTNGERAFDITGTTVAGDAKAAMLASADCPLLWDGLFRDDSSASTEELEANAGFVGRVNYKADDPAPDATFSFDTGGGTEHITQGISNISRTKADGDPAPDCKGAIGVTGDSVDGVDIGLRQFVFTIKKYKTYAEMSGAYINSLFLATWTSNNAPITMTVNWPDGTTSDIDFDTEELVLTRITGAPRPAHLDFELNLTFMASPNKTDIDVGDIVVPAKAGAQYLWVRYQNSTDGGFLVKIPIGAYVDRVYHLSDYTALGL